MPDISNAWPGPFTMAPYFWAPNTGAPCRWGCSNTSTGAARTRLIACHRHWVPGIMKNGCRHCVAWAALADEYEHPGPGGGLEAARVDALRRWRTKDNHRPHPPTHPRDVHMEQPYSLVLPQGVTVVPPCPMMPPPHRKWPQQSMSPPPHARSSHSGKGTALASLDQEEVLEDDFQTRHTLVHHIKWRGDSSSKASAGGGPECSGGSPGQWIVYRLDIGEEEEMLETVDPTWQMTHWLQLAVQGISDDEVPWYECVAPLTSGAEGVTFSPFGGGALGCRAGMFAHPPQLF